MTKHYCDICGKPLDDIMSYRLTYKYTHHDSKFEYSSGTKNADLCSQCFAIFEKTINGEKEIKQE